VTVVVVVVDITIIRIVLTGEHGARRNHPSLTGRDRRGGGYSSEYIFERGWWSLSPPSSWPFHVGATAMPVCRRGGGGDGVHADESLGRSTTNIVWRCRFLPYVSCNMTTASVVARHNRTDSHRIVSTIRRQ
jgi:hypothetical protein